MFITKFVTLNFTSYLHNARLMNDLEDMIIFTLIELLMVTDVIIDHS